MFMNFTKKKLGTIVPVSVPAKVPVPPASLSTSLPFLVQGQGQSDYKTVFSLPAPVPITSQLNLGQMFNKFGISKPCKSCGMSR